MIISFELQYPPSRKHSPNRAPCSKIESLGHSSVRGRSKTFVQNERLEEANAQSKRRDASSFWHPNNLQSARLALQQAPTYTSHFSTFPRFQQLLSAHIQEASRVSRNPIGIVDSSKPRQILGRNPPRGRARKEKEKESLAFPQWIHQTGKPESGTLPPNWSLNIPRLLPSPTTPAAATLKPREATKSTRRSLPGDGQAPLT
jgi:hypothetical protein